MATLNNEVRAFIVKGLAEYKTPQEVANEVNDFLFGCGWRDGFSLMPCC